MIENQRPLAGPISPIVTIPTEKIGLKAGFIICTTLIMYFMIMKYFNFMYSPEAWAFNFIILFVGIILTYRYYRIITKPNIDYFPGLMLGCIATVASVIPFTLFIYFFFSLVDPVLLLLLKDNVLFMGEQISPMRAAAATLVEGISSGVIISFLMMQYFKSGFRRTWAKKKLRSPI